MPDLPDFEADLLGLQQFRDWLESLVVAQQPIEEWSMSLDELKQRWLPKLQESRVSEESVGRLYFSRVLKLKAHTQWPGPGQVPGSDLCGIVCNRHN